MSHSIRRTARAFSLAGALLLAVTLASAQQPSSSLKEQIIGTWSLVAQYVERDGRKIERFGPNPKGILMYDRNGRFAAILMRPNLPKIASGNPLNATPEENGAIVQGSTAFFGRWSVNEADRMMTSRVEGATYPNWEGEDQKRVITISGEEMRSCLPAQIGGTACGIWKRSGL